MVKVMLAVSGNNEHWVRISLKSQSSNRGEGSAVSDVVVRVRGVVSLQ